MEAWSWLERELFLAPMPGNTGDWRFITRRGQRLLEEGVDVKPYSLGILLASESLDAVLVKKVKPLFIRGDYDTAVFHSFKEVEVRVRKASGLPVGLIGVRLMRKAFHPEDGPLTDLTAENAERTAMMELFAGAVGVYKNPVSHRDVVYEDPAEAADVVRFANQLLRITDRRVALAKGLSNEPGREIS